MEGRRGPARGPAPAPCVQTQKARAREGIPCPRVPPAAAARARPPPPPRGTASSAALGPVGFWAGRGARLSRPRRCPLPRPARAFLPELGGQLALVSPEGPQRCSRPAAGSSGWFQTYEESRRQDYRVLSAHCPQRNTGKAQRRKNYSSIIRFCTFVSSSLINAIKPVLFQGCRNSSWSASNASIMHWPSWRESYQINPSDIRDCRNIYKQLQQLLPFATAHITSQTKHSRADEVCLF
ncbi:uncharacterized protein LOC128804932 [Vidua macroura]|uniref:uncharacterized protein LOC128804932 n=1 Tax=Vidua macroura TaxID=187451 RepID=UPI0023A7B0F7|nr:uncharacterized protein LOC128804932 [Vidua macroura]